MLEWVWKALRGSPTNVELTKSEFALGAALSPLGSLDGDFPTRALRYVIERTESWNDIRDIASDGPGYDPDWQKSTEP